MADAGFVQGDNEPPITATLQRNGVIEDLTGYQQVRFQMRKADDKHYTVNGVAQVLNPSAGTVKYSWGASDLNVPGDYLVQWEVTFASGRVETSDPPNTITVRRQ